MAQTCRAMSKVEVVIMLKAFLRLNPGSNNDTFHCMLDIMRYILRLHLDATYPELIAAGFKKFDAVLVQVGSRTT